MSSVIGTVAEGFGIAAVACSSSEHFDFVPLHPTVSVLAHDEYTVALVVTRVPELVDETRSGWHVEFDPIIAGIGHE